MPLRFSTLYRKTKYPSRDFSHTGLGGGIFARLLSAPKARLGGERLRSFAPSREAKQNIFQFLLEEKGSCAKIEKIGKCFALHRRQAGGPAGRVSSVQSRFALCSVIATRRDLSNLREEMLLLPHTPSPSPTGSLFQIKNQELSTLMYLNLCM